MIPDYLISQIREGKTVLFLGSGASRDSTDSSGNRPPDGRGLGKLLSDRFLGGRYASEQLTQISEYAISESSFIDVQQFIRDLFEPFNPAISHKLATTFRWFGIATTNYDLVMERAYQAEPKAAQKLATFIDNTDRVEDRLRNPINVPYLKLHGCITPTKRSSRSRKTRSTLHRQLRCGPSSDLPGLLAGCNTGS